MDWVGLGMGCLSFSCFPDCFLDLRRSLGGLGTGMRAWVTETKKEAGPDEFL